MKSFLFHLKNTTFAKNTAMRNNICLEDFRTRNGLSQSELGSLLGTTGSFISLVESGKNRLSADKVRRIEELASEKGWFLDDLVPAFSRLGLLFDYITTSDGLSDEAVKKFEAAYHRVLPKSLFEAIRFGQQGIDALLASKLVSICPKELTPEKEWLISGEGKMFPWSKNLEVKDNGGKNGGEDDVKTMLQEIAKKQEALEAMLTEIRALLVNKM